MTAQTSGSGSGLLWIAGGGIGGGSDPNTVFNATGFQTAVNLTAVNSINYTDGAGGAISATATGISANVTGSGQGLTLSNGSAITVGSGGTGISATTNGGAISVTTVAGGTISGGAYGIIATGGAAMISLASSVAGSTNSLLLGSAGNAVTLNSGATLSGTADLGSGTNTLTLTGAGTTDTLAVGTLVGATTLTKAGTGTWTVTGAAGAGDFVDTTVGGITTPGVQVLAGRLIEQNTGASLGTGTVNISSGATLELVNTNAAGNNSSVNIGPITFTGTGTLVKSGTGNTGFGNNGTVNFNLSQGAVIDILGGSIEASASYQGNWTNNQSDLEVDTGAIFKTAEAAVRVDRLTGVGNVQIDGTGSLTIGVGGAAATTATFDGTITNQNSPGPLTKTGTGTQTLTGANTYTGATTISTGTLALSGSGTIATSSGIADSGIFDISGLTNGGTTVNALTGSGAVKLGGNRLTLATPGTVAASFSDGGIAGGTAGKVTLSGGGTYVFTGTGSAYTGATTINSGATLQGATNTISGSNIVDNGALIYNQASAGVSSQPISGSGTLDVNGAGAVTLNGNITTSNTLSVSGVASSLTIGGTRSGGGGDSGYDSGVLLNGAGASVAVASTGQIQGGSYIGVRVTGAGDTVSNLGSITNANNGGAENVDAAIADYATSGTLTINNGSMSIATALIEGHNNGINQRGSSTSAITLNNYGLVTGDIYSAIENSGNAQLLTVNNFGSGVIYANNSGNGINAGASGGTSVSNSGKIVGVNAGVYSAAAATVTNTGTIASGTYNAANNPTITLGGNYGVYLAAGGTVTNGTFGGTAMANAASQIEGGAQAGIDSNAALTLTNYGAISSIATGTVDAVTIQGTATVINAGTITAATGGASGIAFVGTGSSITNSGKITGGNSTTYGYGVKAAGAAAGSITNQAGGTITASLGGIGRVGTGAVAIDNSGVVTGTGSTSYGVNVTGGTGTITNRSGGVVVGQTDGILSSAALNVSNAGTIGTGTLSSTTLTTAGVYGLQLAGATNAVTNTGTISTGAAGIFASAGTLALTNTGTISSGNTYGGNTQDAVYANGTSTILNAGLITDATRAGMAATPTYSAINLIGASTVTNASAGVLTGGSDATFGEAIQFHAAGTFNNYGSATGAGNGAVVPDQQRGDRGQPVRRFDDGQHHASGR